MATADESPGSGRYRFGDVVVDEAAHALQRAGQPQSIEPKAFAVLLALLRRPGELIGRDDLLDQVWGHRHVTPGVLTRAIAQLRNVLGDDPQNPRYIQTRHALGYCFVGELLPEPSVSPQALPPEAQAPVVDPQASMDAVTGNAADLQTEAGKERRRASRQLHWRPRHWLAASLLAVVVFAVSIWSARQDVPRPANASVAVLPFTSLGPDRSHDYFAEGLAVEMHDALAGVPGLVVAAQMSPAVAQTREADIKALGQRLGVATVLDASVRREGNHVRISARLSDTTTGYTLWSKSYDRELADVFVIQTEIAKDVVKSLVGTVPAEHDAIAARLSPTKSTVAFDSYLRGLSAFSRGESQEAIGQFGRALASDGGFARAQAGICRTEVWRFENDRNADAFERARLACLRAENMDGSIALVGLALGDLYRVNGNLPKATEYYERVEHDPVLRPEALAGLAKVSNSQGKADVALAQLEEAVATSRGGAKAHAELAYQQYLMGRNKDAIASYRRATELDPGDAHYWATYGALLMIDGDNAAAYQAFEEALRIEPVAFVLSNMGTLKYQAGDYAGAAALYRKAIELNPGDFMVHGFLGDAELADEASAQQATDSFSQAAALAAKYLELRPDDAQATAAMAWYQANLGNVVHARRLASSSQQLAKDAADTVEVALYNAQAFALLGDIEDARRQLTAAMEAGVSPVRIRTNAIFRSSGLVGMMGLATEQPPDAIGEGP